MQHLLGIPTVLGHDAFAFVNTVQLQCVDAVPLVLEGGLLGEECGHPTSVSGVLNESASHLENIAK